MTNVFFKPLVHISPYCCAIVAAYVVNRIDRLHISRFFVAFAWIASFVCKFGIIFAVYPWNKGTVTPTVTVSALYGSTCRTVWSLTLVWDCIACCTGILLKS